MTTEQQIRTGPVPPPPCSAAHIDPLLNEDYAKALTPEPEPPRCRFLSSDKRQCRMLRADHHPDFCLYHAARQEEIFALLPEREFDLSPELVTLAADLTTATGVNRALAEVFRLLAKKHITRKDAVAFGYIAQLLLQTVPGVRAEAISAFGQKAWASQLKSALAPQPAGPQPDPTAATSTAVEAPSLTSSSGDPVSPLRKGHRQDALFAGHRVTPSESAVADESKGVPAAPDVRVPEAPPLTLSSRATNGSEGSLSSRPFPEKRSPPATPSRNSVDCTIAASSSANSAFSRPNYTDLLNRSVDLLNANFDRAPESQRESRQLLRDLERLTPPRVNPAESALPQISPQTQQNVHLQNHST